VLDLLIGQEPEKMSGWKYLERTIGSRRVVEVNPKSDDPRKSLGRCMRMEDACLCRPGPPPGNLTSGLERKSGVLVPHDEPVAVRQDGGENGTPGIDTTADVHSHCTEHSSAACCED
jgi:hypothetical protein